MQPPTDIIELDRCQVYLQRKCKFYTMQHVRYILGLKIAKLICFAVLLLVDDYRLKSLIPSNRKRSECSNVHVGLKREHSWYVPKSKTKEACYRIILQYVGLDWWRLVN